MKHTYIIIFDGECNLCNASVNFIMKRDKQALFSFAPLQSDISQLLMYKYKIDDLDADTIVLIKNKTSYQRAEAIFEICKDLDGLWFLLRIFRVLPSSLNDFLYRFIAKNRYKILGKRSECMLPTAEANSRFLIDPL